MPGPVLSAIEKVVKDMWPGIPVIPALSTGASDSRFLRIAGIAAYGINPLALAETDSRRAHGVDERVPVASFRTGMEFFHRLVRELAGKRGT